MANGVEVYGFIEGGAAEDHVVPKEQLIIFRGGIPIRDDSDPEEWRGTP